jgi:hypothetical protein
MRPCNGEGLRTSDAEREAVHALQEEDGVMTDRAPVKVGERFVRMRTGEGGEVIKVKQWDRYLWGARLRMDGYRVRRVTCSKDGINGYRRKP